jgi:protein disulfide-isomerase A1
VRPSNRLIPRSAQMDATENDIPPQAPFKVSGFPTLKFRAAGSNEFIEYNGDRSLESLIEFVETNAKNQVGDAARHVELKEEQEDDDDDEEEELSEHSHDEL